MSVQEQYDESKDPLVRELGPRYSLKRIIREVHCLIDSEVRNKKDRMFCKGLALCERGTKLTVRDELETVEYTA